MFLKLVSKKASGEFDNHLVEADHFGWGWCKEWPKEYYLPFPISENTFEVASDQSSQVMVVEVFKVNKMKQVELQLSIVVFEATGYLLNEEGKTIDKFKATQGFNFGPVETESKLDIR